MARERTPGMLFILITLFLDVLGIGIIIPILPQLVTELLGGDASRAAFFYGLIVAGYAAMQFLFAPLLGALSDRFGRRPVILVALFGFGVDYLILGFAPTLGWLVAGRLIAGMTGATITAANAYIADVSTPETRARNYGLVGAAFGLGFILGPALGGLLGTLGTRVPFFAAAVLVLANFVYGLLVLPESHPPSERRAFAWREANPLSSMLQLRRYPLVVGLAAALFFAALAQRGLEATWVLYTNYRFGWTELQNGLSLAAVGLMAALVQGGLVRVLVPRLGERRSVLVGLAITAVSFVLFGLASQGWMMIAVIVINAFGALAPPAVQALVAGAVPAREQGQVQGALASLQSLASIAAPLIATTFLFNTFTGADAPLHLPGAPFFGGALFLLAALGIAAERFRRSPLPLRAGD